MHVVAQGESATFLNPLRAWLQNGLKLEALRLGFVFAPLVAFIFIQCAQSEFINLEVWTSVFAALTLSFLVHIVYLFVDQPQNHSHSARLSLNHPLQYPSMALNTCVFFVDALVLSALMFYTGVGSAVFVLLLLLNILLCGLYFQKAYWLAVWSSALYSVVLILSPEVSIYNLYLSIVLNNGAFFVVAGLAQNLSQQLSGATQKLASQRNKIQYLERRQVEQEKLAAVGQLASGVAHEIRNPLASVSGSVQMLSQSMPLNDEAKKLTQIITREVDRLNNLLTELLDFVRPLKIHRSPVNISQVMREVVQVLRLNTQLSSGVEYVCKFEGPISLPGDAEKLKQAFLNIVMNAAQAVKEKQGLHDTEGRVSICISLINQDNLADQEGLAERSAVVGSTDLAVEAASAVCITVEDNGIGMRNVDKIFEVFHTTKKQGTGLGLAIVQKIVQAHEGDIRVESRWGRGTIMVVTLPLQQKL